MSVTVEIRFMGIFQQLSGKKSLKLKLMEPATVRKLVIKLTETFSSEFKRVLIDSQLNDARPNALILVGGKEINVLQGLETKIKDSEEIVFLPMVHGG
ncbi:MAG: MoaD/ThiS family protein [Candidatus Bathyarchaeota archaeon]|nr:MoaD/ThiS family protein [Candidatus Bathyarchaeum sp.]